MAKKKTTKKPEIPADSTATSRFEQELEINGVLEEYRSYFKGFTDSGMHPLGVPGAAAIKIRKAHPELVIPKTGSVMRKRKPKVPKWCNWDKNDFKDKKPISNRKSIDWAVKNVSYRDVKRKDAPSESAWLYLEMFREDQGFLKDILKRRVPNISKIEQDKGFTDDNRETISLVEKLQRELED